jgi:hypothetical protein
MTAKQIIAVGLFLALGGFATWMVTPPVSAIETGLRYSPGPGIKISGNIISTALPLKDQSGGAYTVLTGDNAFLLLVGTGGASLPQAGSAGFPSGWQICFVNASLLGNATVGPAASSPSVFRGAGETTSMVLAPGGFACPESDGTNWITMVQRRGNPVITDSSTNRTLGEFECDNSINFTSPGTGSPPIISVALSATAHPGCSVDVTQSGAGQLVYSASGAAVLHNIDLFTKSAGQYSGQTLRVISNAAGNNAVWFMFGRGST